MSYSFDDFERMQREAERRVNATQRRNSKVANEVKIPDFVSSPTQTNTKSNQPKSMLFGKSKLLDFIDLKNIDFDSDTSIIMVLLLLLSKGEQDELLMLALLYIML